MKKKSMNSRKIKMRKLAENHGEHFIGLIIFGTKPKKSVKFKKSRRQVMRSKLCLMLSSEERKKNGKSQLSNQLMESMEWEANKKKRKNIDLHHPYEINRNLGLWYFDSII